LLDDVNHPDLIFVLIQMTNHTTLLKELIVIDKAIDTPVYLQITNAIIQHILQRKLRKDVRLPGSREMAALLKINRMTVVAAYRELDAQGWIEMRPRKGSFVKVDQLSTAKTLAAMPGGRPAATTAAGPTAFTLPRQPGFHFDENRVLPFYSPDFPPAGKLVLNSGFPDTRLAPVEALARSIRSFSRKSFNKKYLTYGGAQGTLFLRETLAAFLCDTRGLSITPENILVTKGAQMGIYITSSILIKQNEEVIVGTPGYAGANLTFRQTGARINYVPVDEDGLNIDWVEKLCKNKNIRLVYVIPHHHHPTTVILSPERRIRLLELAAEYKFAIVEDDYDYDFHYASRSMMPMASLDRNGNVIYIGTLSKSLAPAIRVGFIVAPVEFIRRATWLRKFIDTQGDSLIENAVAELYKDGTIVRHIKKSVKLYKERRDHFCALLHHELGNSISFKIPDGGMSVWTTFLGAPLPAIVANAFEKGLILGDGTDYDTKKIKYNSVGLGFAALNFTEQERALEILKEAVR
jgi:GntR family transcriptional regulator / MocR family aminotransferase